MLADGKMLSRCNAPGVYKVIIVKLEKHVLEGLKHSTEMAIIALTKQEVMVLLFLVLMSSRIDAASSKLRDRFLLCCYVRPPRVWTRTELELFHSFISSDQVK